LSELALTRTDTNPTSLPGVATETTRYSQSDSAPATISDARVRRDETVTDAHTAAQPAYVPESASYTRDAVSNESLVAARAALAMSTRKERSWRSFIVPLLVLAALGGSVGYFLAGSASAQSNEIHDFIVGKHK
jgi:hypothetical protein